MSDEENIEISEQENEDESQEEESENDDWKPDRAALAEILANQKKELARLQKINKKHVKFDEDNEEVQPTETPTIKPIMIKGRMYNAIAGKNGELQYMDGNKLKKIRNKTLYQEFLGGTPTQEEDNEDTPFNGYEKYRTKKTSKVKATNGNYEVPISNTQTFRQILTNTIIKDAWAESKDMLPQPGTKASTALKDKIKKQNLKFYNEALKDVINNVCYEAGLRNTPSNRDALRAYVADQIKDYNWCQQMKALFKDRIEEMANPTYNQ